MKSTAALTAKQIRSELKAAFPVVKFSVTSETYSGGDCVNVKYTDGPTQEQVEAITNKFCYGSFDGMTDSYNNDNVIEGLPQTKYLFVNREMSTEVREELTINFSIEVGNVTPYENKRINERRIREAFSKIDFVTSSVDLYKAALAAEEKAFDEAYILIQEFKQNPYTANLLWIAERENNVSKAAAEIFVRMTEHITVKEPASKFEQAIAAVAKTTEAAAELGEASTTTGISIKDFGVLAEVFEHTEGNVEEAVNLTNSFAGVMNLVQEYKADPNCSPALWIASENVSREEAELFLNLTKGVKYGLDAVPVVVPEKISKYQFKKTRSGLLALTNEAGEIKTYTNKKQGEAKVAEVRASGIEVHLTPSHPFLVIRSKEEGEPSAEEVTVYTDEAPELLLNLIGAVKKEAAPGCRTLLDRIEEHTVAPSETVRSVEEFCNCENSKPFQEGEVVLCAICYKHVKPAL